MRAFVGTVIAALFTLFLGGATAQTQYENPVDKKTYVAPGGFTTYEPATPRDTRGQRVTTAGVKLLTGQGDLAMRTTVEDLVAFIRAAESKAYPELARSKSSMLALVQFNCEMGKCNVRLASQGDAENSILHALYDALSLVPALKTSGEVVFQVEFHVGG